MCPGKRCWTSLECNFRTVQHPAKNANHVLGSHCTTRPSRQPVHQCRVILGNATHLCGIGVREAAFEVLTGLLMGRAAVFTLTWLACRLMGANEE